MIHEDVELHGIVELRPVTGRDGLRLQRVPENVRSALNPKAQKRMLAPENAEIRFVSSGENVHVTLSAPNGSCEIFPFWGGFQDCQTRDRPRLIVGPNPTTFSLSYPERVRQLDPEVCKDAPFSREVWRLVLMSKCKYPTVYFHGIDGRGIRPPKPSEVPAQCYLAYGTSITDGFAATAPYLTYPAQTAWRLGMDVINLGSAGSAYCEPELADYIAARGDWDIASLEISLNMIGAEYTTEQFRERANYMVDTIAKSNMKRRVVCITPWPYFGDLCKDIEGPHGKGIVAAYRKVLREVINKSDCPNVSIVEGKNLLKGPGGYSSDLAHPADMAMIQIAEELTRHIKPLIYRTHTVTASML